MLNFRTKSRKRWRTLQKQDRGAKQREKNSKVRNFHTIEIKVRIPQSKGWKFRIPQSKVRNWFQGAKTTVQSANSLNAIFAHHCSRCENFRTVRNPLLAHECHFRTPQAKFRTMRNKVRNWVRNAKQGVNSSVENAKISHGKILSCKNS